MANDQAFLSKKYVIRCSHQLQACLANNKKIKENSFHGHHMDVIVTVKGPIDQNSGLVQHRDQLDDVVRLLVIKKYDQSCLNDHLKYPTGERLVEKITKDLLSSPIGKKLHQVQIKETNKNFFSGPICNE